MMVCAEKNYVRTRECMCRFICMCVSASNMITSIAT